MAIMDRERRDREAFDGIENIEDFDPDPSRGLQKKKITKTVTAAILLFLAGSVCSMESMRRRLFCPNSSSHNFLRSYFCILESGTSMWIEISLSP